ncbi:MAG: pyrroline-5-carboxylate reductase, partial [Chloroflexia bacterium]|nr:pyrroline-5-carboxylate reductase [Chloroflexia bacterium]
MTDLAGTDLRLVMVGAGVMAEAMIAGVLARGTVGPQSIV